MQPLARIELNRRDRLGFAVSVPRKDAALIVVARLQFAAVERPCRTADPIPASPELSWPSDVSHADMEGTDI